ncbi:hypothetical protein [Microcystis aeruginosa]|uniref:hypothetical protein n=1 Tax=Microcystis aeruginosa TaxID=1126 RepID=UPI00187CFFD9|nr:hypothetical protein [Microcystis aeruginosa]
MSNIELGDRSQEIGDYFIYSPHTLHPLPHTPHPTPYTLHPTPHTPHPTPYTLHPTPYTPLPFPDQCQKSSLKPQNRRILPPW